MKLPQKIKNNYWYFIAIVLLFPALLINLGLLTILEDEAIRALVALEMFYSGDYIVPTLNGYLYFAKPPLYNWILISFYILSGTMNEWVLRIPTMLFLFIFAYSIFYFTKEYLGRKMAFINALVFITCGRILFWDSMLGLIDICYSMVTYIQIMLIYIGYKQHKYFKLFVCSALFAAIGFMLKGFPSILFQGISLSVWLFFKKDLKRLFSKESILGVGLFCLIVGSYYFLYDQSGALSKAMNGLMDQSTRRTIMHEKNGLISFFKHLISYPIENLFHFFPWSIMIIYFIQKDIRKKIWQNDFIKFNIIMFLANIIVYWSSVEVYPRYILMLAPMAFTVFLGLHEMHKKHNTFYFKSVLYFFAFLILIIIVSGSILPFYEITMNFPKAKLVSFFIVLSTLLLLIFFYLQSNNRLILMVCALLIARIAFDWFVLLERNTDDYANNCRIEALDVGERYKDKDLRIYKSSKIDYTSSWYISKTRKQITQHDTIANEKEVYFVIDTIKFDIPKAFKKIESFNVREFERKLYIIKKK